MEPALLYPFYLDYPAISTDTRNIREDSLFFALKGANFNGNAFAAEALESGARYAIIDEAQYQIDNRFILVDDVLTALQGLARHHRTQLGIPIIGITGTNGKTTTKELLHAVLSQQFKTYATKGNLNNHIGVPLTVLSIPTETEIVIVEMGANHPGEIAFLCDIAQPTHGLITNVGKAHLEGFGGFEGVKRTKGELYDYLSAHGSTLFLQKDNPILAGMATSRSISRVITYGGATTNDLHGSLVAASPLLEVEWAAADGRTYRANTQLTGAYNLENILAAISVGHHFGVPADAITRGITGYKPTNNRSQLRKTACNTVICDYYNANASSMQAALENLRMMEAERKVVVLGDMFEMGDESFSEHANMVDQACALRATRTVFVGKAFLEHQVPGAEFYETTDEAREALAQQPVKNALVLLKASRGMAFERLMENL